MKTTIKTLLTTVILAAFTLTGCSGMFGGNNNNNNGTSANGTVQILTFAPSGAKALAILDEDSMHGNVRGGRNAATDSMVQKILEDGTLESFMQIPEGMSLAPVTYIAQSPNPDSTEIYVVLQYSSWYGYNDPETNEWISGNIGQLLCVHDDGTYDDILKTEDGTWKNLYNADNNSISFDDAGGMYYLVQESTGSSYTNMIYKYNADTNESVQMTPAVNGTYYEKFQVSGDGKWIFAKANNWNGTSSSNYLRAIPTDNPEKYENLFYNSGNGGSWINDWIYDDETKSVFYNKDGSMYSITEKDGTYSQDNQVCLFAGSSNNWFSYGDLFTWTNKSNYIFKGTINGIDVCDPNNEEKLLPEPLFKVFKLYAFDSLSESVRLEAGGVGEDNFIAYFDSHYDIRFDKFADYAGYELLAAETAGKKNLELFKAIADNELETLLAQLIFDDNIYGEGLRYYWYDNNFFADVLYEKDTDNLLSKENFSVDIHESEQKFKRRLNGWDLFRWTSGSNYTWQDRFTKSETVLVNGEKKLKTVVDAEKVYNFLCERCNGAVIDFKLNAFQNIPGYTGLYTDLKNEEAIEFLDNPVKISKLVQWMDNNWSNNNGNGKFLALTCFIIDTDTPAYVASDSVSSTIWWGGVRNFTPSYKKSLYGTYSDCGNGSGGIGLIEILDEEGRPSGNYVEALKSYAAVATAVSENGFYFINALTDSRGNQNGKHQIMYYDCATKEVKNLFQNVENNKNLEVISFSVGGDYCYFCAVEGLDVISMKINVKDLTATRLASGTKLSQIMTMN